MGVSTFCNSIESMLSGDPFIFSRGRRPTNRQNIQKTMWRALMKTLVVPTAIAMVISKTESHFGFPVFPGSSLQLNVQLLRFGGRFSKLILLYGP